MIDMRRFKNRLEAKRYAEATKKNKISVINRYNTFLQQNKLEAGVTSLDRWLEELFGEVSDASLLKYCNDVLAAFDLMMMPQDKQLVELLKKRLPRLRSDNKPDFLTFKEWEDLMQYAKINEPNHYLIFTILYEFTRRPGEVVSTDASSGIKWSDIHFKENTIKFNILKKGRDVEVTFSMPDYIKEMLSEHYKRHYIRDGPIFKVQIRAVEYAFLRCVKGAGINTEGRKISLKILRHSRITHAGALKVPIEVVSKHMARHTRIETTLKYYRGLMEEEIETIPTAKELLEGTYRKKSES